MKMPECAKKLGIQVKEADLHRARYDNSLNKEIFDKLRKKLRA